MPLAVLKSIQDTTAGGVIAVVIIFLVLWYMSIVHKAAQSNDDAMRVVLINLAENVTKQNVLMATITEVLRNVTADVATNTEITRSLKADIKEIKDEILPPPKKRKRIIL